MGSGVNLIPAPLLAQRRRQRSVRRGVRVTAAYLTLLLAATLGYLGVHAPHAADADTGSARSSLASERVSLLQKQLKTTKRQLIETDRQLQGSRVLSERPDWSTLLRLVSLAAGPDVVLRDFTLRTTGPTITAGADVAVAGLASDPWAVSRFVLRLEESGLFDRVTLESSRREPFRDRSATAFSLRCELRGIDSSIQGKTP